MKVDFDNHGGNIEKEARKLGLSTDNIIDASASLVPFKLPKKLNNYLINSIKNGSIRFYPDRSYFELRNAISEWHNIDPSMIFNEFVSIRVLLKILSLELTLSSKEKLYLKPEQPPP